MRSSQSPDATKELKMPEVQVAPDNYGKLDKVTEGFETVIGLETHVQLNTATKEILYHQGSYGLEDAGKLLHTGNSEFSQITDAAEIEKMILQVISENPKQVEQYRGGRTKLQGFFAGQANSK